MRRKVYNELLKWKDEYSDKYALLIEGAIRVGKSYIVEGFAKKEYESYIFIDFYTASEEIKSLFLNYLDDLDNFFLYLENLTGKKLVLGKSLIIFDEVQMFPKARAAIKYLVQDGRYNYIETGSLISINENVNDIMIPSEEMHIEMHPMDFEEFLWATGNETLMDTIKDCFNNQKPLGPLHRKTMDYFKQYMIVGGMPQAVIEYISNKDFERVDIVKREILRLYREDIKKHAGKYSLKVESIYGEIPSELQRHEKKFKITSLNKDAKTRDYDDAFLWLTDAKIVNCCYNATEPTIGLKLRADNSSMKLYFADTGLLISHAFDENGVVTNEVYKKILLGKLELNSGMLIENIVAQMLVSTNRNLYFYSRYSKEDSDERMQVDFLITKRAVTSRHNICPIEVKSNKNYTVVSLNKFKKKYHDKLGSCYIIHTGDYKEEDGIIYLPIYMTSLL